MKTKVQLKFPTIAIHPGEASGTRELKYTDMRRAIAHAIRTYKVQEIFALTPTEKDGKILKNTPTFICQIIAESMPDDMWFEAIQDSKFQEKFFLYVYTYWFDTQVTSMVNLKDEYVDMFKQSVPPALKARFKRIKSYTLYRASEDPTVREKQKSWLDYVDFLLNNEEEPLSEEDVEFYEKAVNYWEEDVKQKPVAQEPLKTIYGLISPKNVRKRFRDLRDNHIEWYNEYVITHPDEDMESYEGRCKVILAWDTYRAEREVNKLRAKINKEEGKK